MPQLLSVADALRLIEERAAPLPARPAPLAEALGGVLAEDIRSDVDSPPHDKAMMDGYAVRSADGEGPRRVVEEVFAGDVPARDVGPGEATRIMTGAPMPVGADLVIPVEQASVSGDSVAFESPKIKAGKHVAPRGELFGVGEVVLERGRRVRSAEMALLAEVGAAEPTIVPAPRVAVLATGAELVAAHQRPGPGQIRNSNGPMLAAAVRELGGEPIEIGVATDDAAALREAIERRVSAADVLLLSGGVSAGDRDLAPGVLAAMGVEQVLHKVAVKPGKPLWFGVAPQTQSPAPNPQSPVLSPPTPIFGLPGNPVSSYVCFQIFVRPLLAALAGKGFRGLAEVEATLAQAITHRGQRETYLPVRLEPSTGGPARCEPVAWRGSADLRGLAAANGLARLPAAPGELAAGAPIRVLRLP